MFVAQMRVLAIAKDASSGSWVSKQKKWSVVLQRQMGVRAGRDSIQLSEHARYGTTCVGLWLAVDAAMQCIGAWSHVFVCAPARGYSLLRAIGFSTDMELVLTFVCAAAMVLAASLTWITRRCCDVSIATEDT